MSWLLTYRLISLTLVFLMALAALLLPPAAVQAGRAGAIRHPADEGAVLGGVVWNDQDGDGRQDEGPNTGLDGVGILLFADDGDGSFEPGADDGQVGATTTAGGGLYHFDLPGGAFWIEVDPSLVSERGYVARAGAESAVSPYLAVATPGEDKTIAFGYVRRGAINGVVFADGDQNGEQDLSEQGLADVELRLYGDANGDGKIEAGDALLARTFSAADGGYIFRDLLPADYVVVSSIPPGATATTPVLQPVHLLTGEVGGAAYDFGVHQVGGLRLFTPRIRG